MDYAPYQNKEDTSVKERNINQQTNNFFYKITMKN